MKRIRKNASLKSVAVATRKRADRAKAKWLRLCDAKREAPLSDQWRLSCEESAAYAHYSDLDEVASHLERLSGITTEAA